MAKHRLERLKDDEDICILGEKSRKVKVQLHSNLVVFMYGTGDPKKTEHLFHLIEQRKDFIFAKQSFWRKDL